MGVRRTAKFIISRRLYTPPTWMCALRYLKLRIFSPHIETEGFVFIGPNVELYARRGYGRLILGRWSVLGPGNAIRCHEGTLRIGSKTVMGGMNTVNCYLDIEIGSECIFGQWIYICDFDHRYGDMSMPIRKQGIVKSPVKIGNDCWIGEKVTVLRGVTIGDGCVIASHALVNRDIPDNSVAGGVPARVLKTRGKDEQRS